jgi:hypothetical protein
MATLAGAQAGWLGWIVGRRAAVPAGRAQRGKAARTGSSADLFGSRAAGTARPASDYDLLFVFPSGVADWRRGQSRGSVSSLASDRSVELSIGSASEDEWRDPPEVSRPLIDQVKATGIEVPYSAPV